MILDDNSREINVRWIDFISLKDNTIVFHLKGTEKKTTKTFNSDENASEEFKKLSRRIEHYVVVKAGRPLKDQL